MSPNWLVLNSLTFNSSSMFDTLLSRPCFSCKEQEKKKKYKSSRGQQTGALMGRWTRDDVKLLPSSLSPGLKISLISCRASGG